MSKTGERNFQELLPDDQELLKRTLDWGTLFDKTTATVENEKMCVPFKFGMPKHCDNTTESVSPSEFEDTENGVDSNFNVQDILKRTSAIIAHRKSQWHKSGLDTVMDALQDINSKVTGWLENGSNLFPKKIVKSIPSLLSSSITFPSNKHKATKSCHEFNSERDTMESVDTAEYILSNRIRTKSKLTTMTIKRYRYSKDSLARKSNFSNQLMLEQKLQNEKKNLQTNKKTLPWKRNRQSESLSPQSLHKASNDKASIRNHKLNKKPECHKKRRFIKDKADNKYSTSESSLDLHKSSRKRVANKSCKLRYRSNKSNSSPTPSSIISDAESSSDLNRSIKNVKISSSNNLPPAKKIKYAKIMPGEVGCKVSVSRTVTSNIKPSKKYEVNLTASKSSIEIYTPKNENSANKDCNKYILNKKKFSDTLGKDLTRRKCRRQSESLSPKCIKKGFNNAGTSFKKYSKRNHKLIQNPHCKEKSNISPNPNSNISPIEIYTPKNENSANRDCNKYVLNKKTLYDSLGKDLTLGFLNKTEDFCHEFDSSSQILFYPPTENQQISSSESESDILDGNQLKNTGRIVELVTLLT